MAEAAPPPFTDPERQAEYERSLLAEADAKAKSALAAAEKAGLDNEKARREEAEAASSSARRARAAKHRQEVAEAEGAAAKARSDRAAALVPDLGSVKESTLEVAESTSLWSHALSMRALGSVANQIVTHLRIAGIGTGARVLVTSDEELATTDAIHADVRSGLDQLFQANTDLLARLQSSAEPEEVEGGVVDAEADEVEAQGLAGGVEAVAGAITAAVPSVLSLFSAKRALSSSTVSISDLAASAAVAGALVRATGPSWLTVVHDDIRLLPEASTVYALAASVAGLRSELRVQKIVVSARKDLADAAVADAEAAVAALRKLTPPPGDLQAQIEAVYQAVEDQRVSAERDELLLAQIDDLGEATDQFLAAIRVAPEGAHRSPLATAALHEQLHGSPAVFSHVLLVNAEGGESQQLTTNRALWLRDRFSTVAHVSVTYVCIRTGDSVIVASGVRTGTAVATGKVGSTFAIDVQ